ncbi:glucose PTS transporter transcription antiterminator GlcT [Ornithinibacillus halophilus]|uniref:Transcriptional antiterminator, BglG family n=1 Tax=Ornithinibacillus halophilus TaxID=930117 RepID=A0A1M5GD18_9BACI|nr:transcription antiterminator [Ornithinibacillus halophilus]SHG01569.1 transcriptional antiterminator, BglG family [Ornithinibacillus halophilus]
MQVKKVLNNNVVIAEQSSEKEVLLIGKGIGFSKKEGQEISADTAEKVFRLEDPTEQDKYKQLLPQLDEDFIQFMHDVLSHIEKEMGQIVNEHIHIGLTDHIAFAIKRAKEGINIKNPFLVETEVLYHKEYMVAKTIVSMIKEFSGVQLPDGEIGLIAIHIHSSVTDRNLSDINKNSTLVFQLIQMIEDGLDITLKRDSINYFRLVQHIRFAIDRVSSGVANKEQTSLGKVLKMEYPMCYNLAWKIVKVMQQTLKKPVVDAEVIYLTIHLQRLLN